MDYFMKKISRFARNDNTHHGVEDRKYGGATAMRIGLQYRRRTLVWIKQRRHSERSEESLP
jgi:hypothetical protein